MLRRSLPVAFLSRPVNGSRQCCHVPLCGRLTPVRVAGVSVRPVALSQRPWRMHSCHCPLTHRVKVLNAMGRSIASRGPKAKSLGRHPFLPSLLFFPFPSSPAMGRFPSDDRDVVAPAGSWRASWSLRGARSWWPTDVKGPIGVHSS
ncbi:hypothetical protein Taro_042199 [Colocasia esculenta]|uniref:Uncharacterized protein n=1 Tax=Colocasia esculenta TaxID=4460 RepID=A0A843X236_COLES|nr:hypothetical protein [Colocasia esculenta]